MGISPNMSFLSSFKGSFPFPWLYGRKILSLLKNQLITSEYFHPRVHLLVALLWLLLSNQITTNPQTLLIWGVSTGVGSSQKNKRLEPYTRHFCGKTTYPCFWKIAVHPSKKGWNITEMKKRTKSSSTLLVILDTSSHFSLSLRERFMNMISFLQPLEKHLQFLQCLTQGPRNLWPNQRG